MIIGLTGENCAGKSTICEYLRKKGFYYLSLSDVIREELSDEGIEITRDTLIKKGNRMREQFGPGILATKVLLKVEGDKNYIIDSIRNAAEVEGLKKNQGFFLFYITAPSEVRFQRMKARKREGDPVTFEAFVRIEEIEKKSDKATHQSIMDAVSKADKKIVNDGDLQHLFDLVDKALGEVSEKFRFERPSWDEYFMGIAKVVASRSNCIKRKVAAVIVKDKRIISTGYNGTPRGVRNCNEGGCPRCNSFAESGKNLEECYCSHGEENAIVQASYHGIPIKGAIIYTTFSPCLICTKMILNAGLSEVIYNAEYPLAEAPLKLLKEAGIVVRQVKI
ncbi:Dephospho-CoA kinase [Candidatus Bilamarchaeum dharawalense]|uniref:Dephospho-CoA kinase n=1 Tax=Candidatus Bilamarchaeum dharawalense TaxID=2885759 RepID=A0A5E4LQY9_9ARCH|nr:Dephospho-CoA kinase [Candidatus Bilamarchaeum dharawalense]